MTNHEFAAKVKDAAAHKTLYIKGCFGAPMTAKNKARYSANNDYNKKRAAMINAASEDTFGFDCVCLLKGILWGWCADVNDVYGGAKYASNGVKDLGTEEIIGVCAGVSTDFSDVAVGELLWKQGHVGVYIGDGLAVESTPTWKNGAQITAVGNIGKKAGYNARTWTKHGKLPYVEYVAELTPEQTPAPEPEPDTSEPSEPAYRTYTTTSSDTLWGIAKRFLGAGKRYVEIKELNGLMSDIIRAGMKLKIPCDQSESETPQPETPAPEPPAPEPPAPEPPAPEPPAPEAPKPRTYTVKSDDTLWGIAKRELGSGVRYTEIMKLNGLKSEIIRAGMTLTLPER